MLVSVEVAVLTVCCAAVPEIAAGVTVDVMVPLTMDESDKMAIMMVRAILRMLVHPVLA